MGTPASRAESDLDELDADDKFGAEGAAPAAPASTALDRARAHLEALDLGDLAAVAAAVLFPLAHLPNTPYGDSTVRFALLVVVLPLGLASLLAAARHGDRTARWGVAFGAAVLLSIVVARHPLPALVGDIDSRSSGLITLGYLGCWGLGRRFRGPRWLLLGAVLVGTGLNLAMIVAQHTLLDDVRPSALAGNPVFAAALFAAAVAIVAGRSSLHGRGLAWAALVAPLGYGIGVSGSRIAVVAALAALILLRFKRPLTLLLLVGCLLLGVGLASATSQESAGSRLTSGEGGGGFAPRVEMWGHGVDAWLERPLLGWGPGRFLEATSPRVTLDFARQGDPASRYSEAHNIFVEYLTATGVLGLVALAGFMGRSFRYGRGTSRGVALALLVCHLFEPQSLVITPLLFLFLGASLPVAPIPAGGTEPGPRSGVAVVALATLAALVVGALALGCDLQLDAAEQQSTGVDESRAAQRLMPLWPTPAYYTSVSWLLENDDDPGPVPQRASEGAADRALELDPTRPQFLFQRGLLDLRWGDPEDAFTRLLVADRQAPWIPQTLLSLRAAARDTGNSAVQRRTERQLCAIDPTLLVRATPPGSPAPDVC